jgi:hypothetical protein
VDDRSSILQSQWDRYSIRLDINPIARVCALNPRVRPQHLSSHLLTSSIRFGAGHYVALPPAAPCGTLSNSPGRCCRFACESHPPTHPSQLRCATKLCCESYVLSHLLRRPVQLDWRPELACTVARAHAGYQAGRGQGDLTPRSGGVPGHWRVQKQQVEHCCQPAGEEALGAVSGWC